MPEKLKFGRHTWTTFELTQYLIHLLPGSDMEKLIIWSFLKINFRFPCLTHFISTVLLCGLSKLIWIF